MLAAAAMTGAVDATNPGATVTSLPFSDNFNRPDGDPGQPWYSPSCPSGSPTLQIVSNSLQAAGNVHTESGLLLASADFDLTFTVNYSAANGRRDDVQVALHRNACWGENEFYLIGTNPGPGGGNGVTVFKVLNGTFPVIASASSTLAEGTSHTFRVLVVGTSLKVYVDNLTTPVTTSTMDSLPGQQAVSFVIAKQATSIDNLTVT